MAPWFDQGAQSWLLPDRFRQKYSRLTNEAALAGWCAGIHIAAAVKTPSVCILGGGHFGRFLPYPKNLLGQCEQIVVYKKMDCYGCNWNCVYTKRRNEVVPCVQQIDVDMVIKAVHELLSKKQVHIERSVKKCH